MNHKGVLIVARHGARRDYEMRNEGENWVSTNDRPHDPPLSEEGFEQAIALGDKIQGLLAENGLGDCKVSCVYSSPLLRCVQTANGAISRLNELYRSNHEMEEDDSSSASIKLRIEHGLVESLSLNWYSSWCLPGSDSSWGFYQKLPGEKFTWDEKSLKSDDDGCWNVHELATRGATELFLPFESLSHIIGDGQRLTIDYEYTSLFNLEDKRYRWGNFETRKNDAVRMGMVARTLLNKHPGETILLVSHGGPTTHLYAELTGCDFDSAPLCRYTGTSLYINKGDGMIENLVVNV